MKKIKAYLNKPFPFIEKTQHKIIASFLFSAFIYTFLIIFQPFGIVNIPYYKPLFILGFFGITFIVLLNGYLIAPYFFRQFFNTDNWTIRKNLIFISIQILIIAILNWLYNSTVGKDVTEQHNLFSFLFITISIGFFPTILLNMFIEKYLSKKHQNIAENLTHTIQSENKSKDIQKINIISENENESMSIELDQLICIKSEGNYVDVYFYKNEKINKQFIRNSLTKLGKQLIIFENIKRCHRSYIVNFSNIEKVSGNARNFNLHIKMLDFTIPVSRSFPKEIITKYN